MILRLADRRVPTRLGRVFRAAAWAMVAALGGPSAVAAAAGTDFDVHWSVTTCPVYLRQTGRDLQALVDTRSLPIIRDAKVLYAHRLGLYPYQGPHIPLMEADYMQRHFAELAADLDREIPDPNYAGFVAIDYEHWYALWDWTRNDAAPGGSLTDHDRDFHDDWEEYLLTTDPDIFRGMTPEQRLQTLKDTFNVAAQNFLLATLRECKRLRPRAQWSFYNYPFYGYTFVWRTNRSQDREQEERQRREHEAMSQFYAELDFLAPSLYVRRVSMPESRITDRRHETTIDQNREFFERNVREARRLAQGKPVLPFVWLRYHPHTGPHAGQPLNDADLENQFVTIANAGADGVLLWEYLQTEEAREELERFLHGRAGDYIRAAAGSGGSNDPSGLSASPHRGRDRARRGEKRPAPQVVVRSRPEVRGSAIRASAAEQTPKPPRRSVPPWFDRANR